MSEEKNDLMNKIISICSQRGILIPGSEIYGGLAGFYDYGNIGSQLKRNIENSWWNNFVSSRQDIAGIDGTIITHPTVWKASGHTEAFNDPLVECKKCHKRFRADHLVESKLEISVDGFSLQQIQELIDKHKIVCPDCKGEFTLAKPFNLMFKTHVGPAEDNESIAYLRPETAQLIFADFKQVSKTSRKKLPFGIAQIGKSFRNEISPRNFIFRLREFSQMEIEFFVHPEKINKCELLNEEQKSISANFYTADMQEKKQEHKEMKIGEALKKNIIKTEWHAYWIAESLKWFYKIGIKNENLRLRQHVPTELSHYSSETWDVEYKFPFGWKELQGIANRTDFDLKQHMKFSKEDLQYFDEETKTKIIPYVIEPSWGLERAILVCLLDSYTEEKDRTYLKLNPKIAPVQIGIFPLMKKDNLPDKAKEVLNLLREEFRCDYDETGSVGKRYARNDEIGTPFCITIDYDSLEKDDVTVRERDSMKQVRIKIKDLKEILKKLFNKEIIFEKAGELVK